MFNNKRLYEVLTRHQIYVEGVKAQYAIDFNKVLRELDAEFTILFSKLRFDNLDALTKAGLRSFLVELKKVQTRVYSEYTKTLIGELQAFMNADILVSKTIFATMAKPEGEDEEPVTEDEADDAVDEADIDDQGNKMFPSFWFKSPQNGGDSSKLWSAITNAPIPANGILMLPFISGFTASAMSSIENIVRKGYANRSSVKDVLNEITGTLPRNYRDGAFARIKSQASAVTDTAVQHVTSVAQAGIASIFFARYRWASVVDNNTTEICKGRNNRVFNYGEGPLPPAHIKCRSKTVPIVGGETGEPPSSYYAFLKSQPAAVQNDILGESQANNIRSGKTKSKDIPQFDNANPLSVDGFVSKLNLILTR